MPGYNQRQNNVNPQNSEPFTEEEYEQTKIIDFRTIINFQINDCRRMLSQPATYETCEFLKQAINTLASLICFIHDNVYEQKMKELNIDNSATINSLSAQDKQARRSELEHEYYRRKFELLLAKATRKGFTLARDIKDTV